MKKDIATCECINVTHDPKSNLRRRCELYDKFKSNIPITRRLTVTPSPAFVLSKLNFTDVTAYINMEVSDVSTSSRAQISLDDGSVPYYLPYSCSSFLVVVVVVYCLKYKVHSCQKQCRFYHNLSLNTSKPPLYDGPNVDEACYVAQTVSEMVLVQQ